MMSGNQVLRARLRPANQDASAGSWKELDPVVKRLRRQWPEVKIIVRADSGFCREGLLLWCEQNKVDYVLGLARNKTLRGQIEEPMRRAREGYNKTGEGDAGVQPVQLPDGVQDMEPLAARGGQGRVHHRQREPALHRDESGAGCLSGAGVE